jgi:beta-N-acetylhexosaminidase
MRDDPGVVKAVGCAFALALVVLMVSPAGAPAVAEPSVADMVGQKLVVSMDGTTPSASLLARAQAGKIGGVLIHRYNFSSAAQLQAITAKLQQAAAAGGRPELLIAVDQEGGAVKTVSGIPPTLSPPEMGALGSTDTARRQGRMTGHALRGLGVNTDFAPVADVPALRASFMYEEGRTWSFSARKTARLANAFALGLRDRGTVATMKHFPGLGFATRNTDSYLVHVAATRDQLAPGLRPYRLAVQDGVPLVMLSNAVYDAYDGYHGAGWSRPIVRTLLRGELGFRGATITDSLDAAARTRATATARLAIGAARAGTDFLLLTGSEASSRSVYASVLQAASDGRIPLTRLRTSYRRIVALKGGL